MKPINQWTLIEPLNEWDKGNHRFGLYRCGGCQKIYKVRIPSVEADQTKMCRPCSTKRLHRELWEVKLPDGRRVTVCGLRNWCITHGLPYTTLYRSYQRGKPSNSGYLVRKIGED